jgi:hypothetical protein
LEGVEVGLIVGGIGQDWRDRLIKVPVPDLCGEALPSVVAIDAAKIPSIKDKVDLVVILAEDVERSSVKLFHLSGNGTIDLKGQPLHPGFYTTSVRIEMAWRHTLSERIRLHDPRLVVKTTWFPKNCVYITSIDSYGSIDVFCLSLVSQGGQFFAVMERVNKFQAYWRHVEPQVVFPGCGWKQFEEKILQPAFAGWDLNQDGYLPDVSEFRVEAVPEAPFAGAEVFPNTATVQWYNAVQGRGVVILPDGTLARVHWENIVEVRNRVASILLGCKGDANELLYLCPGDVVSFGRVGKPENTGKHPTEFQLEIFEVMIDSPVGEHE